MSEAFELVRLAGAENDEETIAAVVDDIDIAEAEREPLEFRRMFSNAMDSANAFLDVQAGSGGTEAQDWAEMLRRM